MSDKKPIIELKNVSVVYQPGKTSEVWGARNLSLKIYPEEYVVFFGPSGSGKSTLLYVIAGLEKPAQGEVVVQDRNIAELGEKDMMMFHRSTIGIIFQAFYLIPDLSIKDNLLLPLIFRKAPFKERLQKIRMLSDRFGLSDLMSKRPSELSGGQQQRTAAARALVNDPEIILADEPVGNLDTKNAEITMQLLDELNQRDKKTIILVTHDPRYLAYAHRVFYIKDGQIENETYNAIKQVAGAPGQAADDLQTLNQIYPYATSAQLKAKLIFNQLLIPFTLSEQGRIESVIEKYLMGQLDEQGLLEALDRPETKGGLDLYRQTAKNLTRKISDLAKEIADVDRRKGQESQEDTEDEILGIRRYLLDNTKTSLSLAEVALLDQAVSDRLKGKAGPAEFRQRLDLPLKQGGVGLNRRTAKNISRLMELLLMDQNQGRK
ncbi:MAG: ABC transporter ATP-binding protein [Candidatus Saccharibacteria bacterium]